MKPINEKNFVSFYKILGLKNGPQDENKIITDEMVEKAYIDMKEQLLHLQEKAKTEKEKMYLQKIEESIKEAYRVLRTERGRKENDELEKAMLKAIKDKKQENKIKEEMPRKLNTEKNNKYLSEEQYENARKATEDVAKKMEELDSVNFTPIYKGKIGELPPKNREDDEGR